MEKRVRLTKDDKIAIYDIALKSLSKSITKCFRNESGYLDSDLPDMVANRVNIYKCLYNWAKRKYLKMKESNKEA